MLVQARTGVRHVQYSRKRSQYGHGTHVWPAAAALRPHTQGAAGVSNAEEQDEAEQLLAYRRRLRFGVKPGSNGEGSQSKSAQEAKRAAGHRQRPSLGSAWASAWSKLKGRMLYNYYNYRQDTTGDLQLIVGLNVSLALLLGLIRRHIVDDEATRQAGSFWSDLYQVVVWIFGQEFPSSDAAASQQVFSVVVAAMGLTAFALVLALMEQVVLETMDANVEKGSVVYENGHIVLLAWGKSQRDMEVVRKILQQVCVAYKPEGGTTVVVLSQRSKLEMEATFWRCLPATQRHGTKLVFRQGSALIPSDLRMVAASTARVAVIVSDQSRGSAEADAQSLRSAILLDELTQGSADSLPRPYMVVELKTSNSMPLLKYACSSRVMAVQTVQLNAQRLAKMVKRPVISIVSQQLFNFEHNVSNYTHAFPELAGCRFRELAFRFPDGIVLGVVDGATGQAVMNPPGDYKMQSADKLVLCRPTAIASRHYKPLPQPVQPASLCDAGSSRSASRSNSPARMNPQPSVITHSQQSFTVLPLAGGASAGAGNKQSAPYSSSLWAACDAVGAQLLTLHHEHTGSTHDSISSSSDSSSNGGADGSCEHAHTTNSTQPDMHHHAQAVHVSGLIPPEFLRVDDQPEKVLVAGWGQKSFMTELLKELDHGTSCLPPGSDIVFVNAHDPDDSLGLVLQTLSLENVSVHHIRADPLLRGPLSKIDLSDFRCAMVLCDEQWVDADLDETNGIDNLDEPSVLRLDSLAMVVQLNIRKLLEDQALPPINMIAQKCAAEGLTRFEDRHRLPLGICVNLTSFAAKMLTQVAFNPAMLAPLTKLGEGAGLTIVDAGCYCLEGEAVSFWELMARAQQARDVLVGYYAIPEDMDQPLESVVNPMGNEVRMQKRVWNCGDGRVKFIVLRSKMHNQSWGSGSHDDLELETTQQAQWIQMRGSANSTNSASKTNDSASISSR